MKRLLKIMIWTGVSLSILMIALLLLISPIAKYLVEKNAEEYVGRKISLNSLKINLLNGKVNMQGLTVLESDKTSPFITCDTFALDMSLMKLLFSAVLDINYIHISGLTANVTQQGDTFNFDDMLEKFTAEDTTTVSDTMPSEPFHYYLHDLSINNGHFWYTDPGLGSKVEVTNARIHCPLIAWDQPGMSYGFSFNLQSEGKVDGNFDFISETLDYLINLKSKSINLALLHPYLKGYMSVKTFEGSLDSDLKLKGNFNTPSVLALQGNISLNNLLVTDRKDVKTLSWSTLMIDVDTLNTAGNLYDLNNISLSDPYVLFEMYDNGSNNFYDLMNLNSDIAASSGADSGTSSSTAYNPFKMLVDLISEMTRQYIITDYNIDKLTVSGGKVLYRDFSLDDKFEYELENLSFESSGITSSSERVTATLQSVLNNHGTLEMIAEINPKDFKNMELICKISEAPVPDFSPYSKYYVAHPFTGGKLSFSSENKLVDNFLTSNNKVNISRMEVGKKIKRKDALNVPVRLAVSLLKDTKGNIKLEIPVEGDLNDPKYKLGKAIWGIVENILVKAATAPFRLLANTFGGNEEELKELRFEYLQTGLTSEQLKKLDKLAGILIQKPELCLEVTQTAIAAVEKEQLAVFEARKMFYQAAHAGENSFNEAIVNEINGISLKDSLFNNFLDGKLKLPPGNNMPALNKCINMIGNEILSLQVRVNFTKREAFISDYLTGSRGIKAGQLKFLPPDEKSITAETPPRMVFNIKVEE